MAKRNSSAAKFAFLSTIIYSFTWANWITEPQPFFFHSCLILFWNNSRKWDLFRRLVPHWSSQTGSRLTGSHQLGWIVMRWWNTAYESVVCLYTDRLIHTVRHLVQKWRLLRHFKGWSPVLKAVPGKRRRSDLCVSVSHPPWSQQVQHPLTLPQRDT